MLSWEQVVGLPSFFLAALQTMQSDQPQVEGAQGSFLPRMSLIFFPPLHHFDSGIVVQQGELVIFSL